MICPRTFLIKSQGRSKRIPSLLSEHFPERPEIDIVGIVILDYREGHKEELIAELILVQDGLEDRRHLLGRIPERSAAESSQNKSVVVMAKGETEYCPDLVRSD